MIKRHIIETIEEYNEDGTIKEKRVIETTEDDDSPPMIHKSVSEPVCAHAPVDLNIRVPGLQFGEFVPGVTCSQTEFPPPRQATGTM